MPFRPTHRQLQYLVAVADCGNFRRAAEACGVSQPTLSMQLKALEEQLGTALVERSAQEAKPTPTGQLLLPMARSVLAILDDMVAAVEVAADNMGGLIRLGVAPTVGPYVLPKMLPHLHANFPKLELYIREDRPQTLEDRLTSGALDCILTPRPLGGGGFAVSDISVEKVFLGIPADHPLAGRSEVSVTDLAGNRLLTLGSGHKLYDEVQRLCRVSGAILAEDYEGTSLDALRQMVSIGMGLSLFPATYVLSEFDKEENVVLRDVDGWDMKRVICLAWRRDSARASNYSLLADEVRRAFAILEDGTAIMPKSDRGP